MQETTGILISMKEIVIACKGISQDVTALEDQFPDIDIVDTKVKLSEALTKLMGSSKECATNFTPTDLDNLYSHASDLNKIVEKLVNTFIATSHGDMDDQENSESSLIPPLNSFDYYDIADNDYSTGDLKVNLFSDVRYFLKNRQM